MDDIETVLEGFFVEREGEGVRSVLRTVDLFQSGLLDSLDLVTLAVLLEKRTGHRIDVTSEAALTAMRTFSGMVELARRQSQQS